jgi:molecular chaperone GrpE
MANKEQSEHVVDSAAKHVGADKPNSGHTADAPDVAQPEESVNVEKLQADLDEARAKADDYWNRLLRAQAEMENLRKRNARELEQAHRFALERFATELLAVKDSLEMGVDAASGETEAEKLREGTELTLKMLIQVMEKFNIEEIDPKGLPFDPARHQAMTTQENRELPPNTVVTVMQKGYALNGRLLRPAMVIVSKAPEGEARD